MARLDPSRCMIASLLLSVLLLLPAAGARAWQAPAPPPPPPRAQVFVPPPVTQFQQVVRYHQANDQWQKRQLQQQLHQSVSDQARLPSANNPALQQQLGEAAQAQRDRYRAAQQDLMDRYQTQADSLPRVMSARAPASSRSGG